MIVIRPEPRIRRTASTKLPSRDHAPRRRAVPVQARLLCLSTSNIHTGDLRLRDRAGPSEGNQEGTGDQVPGTPGNPLCLRKRSLLPPLGELVAQACNDRKRHCLRDPGGTSQQVFRSANVCSEAVDGRVDVRPGRHRCFWLTGSGNRVKSSGSSSSKLDNRAIRELEFRYPQEISGEPGKCQLAFEVPGTGEKTIGPLERLGLHSPFPAGATMVRITRAYLLVKQSDGREGDTFEVRIEFDGFPIIVG